MTQSKLTVSPHKRSHIPDIANIVRAARVDAAALDTGWYDQLVDDPAAGACVTFEGRVRNHDGGRGVCQLEYSAHPTAETVLRKIADDVARAQPGARAIAVGHRIGLLNVGDVALYVVVSAAHRRQAFAACEELVEAVKREVPIWKLQSFTEGAEHEWVGAP